MIFTSVSSIMAALLELCCARSKPDKVAALMLDPAVGVAFGGARSPARDTEEMAQQETDKILSYHNKRKCC